MKTDTLFIKTGFRDTETESYVVENVFQFDAIWIMLEDVCGGYYTR